MTSTIKTFLLCVLCMLAATNSANCQQDAATGSWVQLSNGIAVNVTLSGSFVAVSVKNTSNSPLKIVGDDRHLVRFFYIDSNHARVPLRDKSEVNVYASRKVAGSAVLPPGGGSPFHLQIELTPEELTAIQTYPVVCRFTVSDPTTQQYFKMETTPKVLSSGP